MKSWFVWAIAVGVLLGSTPAHAADPFVIEAVFPLSGSGAFLGKAEAQTLGVMETLINRAGGISGQPVHFNVQDDASSPQVGVQLMTALTAKHVPFVFGSALVAVCNAMFPVSKDLLMYCFSTGYHPPEGSLSFSGPVSTVDQITAGIRYLRDRGLKRIAVLTSNDATGTDADRIIDSVLAQPDFRAVAIVNHEHFGVTDVSVSAQIAQIKASGAQALVGWTTGNSLGTILHGYQDAGMKIAFVGGSGNLSYGEMKAFANLMPSDCSFPGSPALDPRSLPAGPIRRAAEDFQAAFLAAGQHPDISSGYGYDQVMMVVNAFRKLGPNATALQLRNYIINAHFNGVNGTYDFAAHPGQGLGSNGVVMLRWNVAKDSFDAVSGLGGAFKP
jgi:branched-chain amino acid transport system substrate-binding protein